jgi:hypothetical protein
LRLTFAKLELEISKLVIEEDFQIKKQIFEDFLSKAGSLINHPVHEWSSLRSEQGLRLWTRSVYAAYQLYLCYLHGFGTRQNISSAGKYLALSACGGYCSALSVSVRFNQRYPDVPLPGWAPNIEGIFQTAMLGFWSSIDFFNLDMELLEQLAPEKAIQVRSHVNACAFSELGEDHFDGREHQEGSFPGPDIRYQWFPTGSIQLFERLFTRFNPSQIVAGFQSGLFTPDSRNYNGETELYICCRAGNAGMTKQLLNQFEWARNQAKIPTKDGLTPFHFLYRFSPGEFEDIADALLANGAEINANDNSGRRAVDYAISAGREEVALYLLDKRECFSQHTYFSPANMSTAQMNFCSKILKSVAPTSSLQAYQPTMLPSKS